MKPELSKNRWNNFRRALLEKDREAFDEMVDKAKMHAQAITNAAFPDQIEGRLLSILLENEKELRRLRMR